MKKLYEKNCGWDLYCRLLLEKGDKVKCYWLDCVISMDSIHKYRETGVDSFVAILRENGAVLLPIGTDKEHSLMMVRHYAINEPDSLMYVLNYKEKTIYELEAWDEAETIIKQGF